MCAINGFTWEDTALVERMNAATRHRGPDGTAVFTAPKISLGHNRLSIIDLSEAGRQPMESGDGNLIIVFNGEIYNFTELKKELSPYPFRSQSDTEVVLAAYKKWGKSCVERMNGIFAFAIWDKDREELFIARDHMGVKPFYYFWNGARFIFSSEIKAILEHSLQRVLDQDAFSQYLRLEYVPEPLTMFKGIRKLPAAHRGYFKEGSLVLERYWGVVSKPENLSWDESVSSVRSKVETAVRRQLVSDRPVGIYLSGGIDSSVVLAAASTAHPHIGTFSVGFDLTAEEEVDKFNIDFDLARRTASFFGATHHEMRMSSRDIIPLLEDSVRFLDEPISNPTSIPMLKLSGFAKQHVAVALGGDGGDEVFGGYDRYRLSRMASLWQQFVPAIFRDALAPVHKNFEKLNVPPGIERYMLLMTQKLDVIKETVSPGFFDHQSAPSLLEERYFSDMDSGVPFELYFMDTDRQAWLVDEALVRTDKLGMANGVEMRVPLLDKDVVEYATHLPVECKVSPWATKIALKAAFRDVLPNYLFNQPKRGWIAPGAKWLRHPHMQEFAREVLSEGYYAGTHSLFRWNDVRRVLDDHITKKRYNLGILWALLTFQIWAKQNKVTIG